jgi:hypothetical protein
MDRMGDIKSMGDIQAVGDSWDSMKGGIREGTSKIYRGGDAVKTFSIGLEKVKPDLVSYSSADLSHPHSP